MDSCTGPDKRLHLSFAVAVLLAGVAAGAAKELVYDWALHVLANGDAVGALLLVAAVL